MWFLSIANTLYRDNMFSVQADQRCQARIDASMVDLFGRRVELADDDGTGTASAFATSPRQVSTVLVVSRRTDFIQFCAREPNSSQVFENCNLRINLIQDNPSSVEIET